LVVPLTRVTISIALSQVGTVEVKSVSVNDMFIDCPPPVERILVADIAVIVGPAAAIVGSIGANESESMGDG
jgi:hypothetical protein